MFHGHPYLNFIYGELAGEGLSVEPSAAVAASTKFPVSSMATYIGCTHNVRIPHLRASRVLERELEA